MHFKKLNHFINLKGTILIEKFVEIIIIILVVFYKKFYWWFKKSLRGACNSYETVPLENTSQIWVVGRKWNVSRGSIDKFWRRHYQSGWPSIMPASIMCYWRNSSICLGSLVFQGQHFQISNGKTGETYIQKWKKI